ncbi:glycoside hydrolase, family 108, partial [Bordetella bronchiseptica 00-P-2730]
MDFDTAFDRLIGHEGGYSNNPADPGGETMWGVTAAVARANGYTGPMRDMPRDTAKAIYRARYWTPVRGDMLPPAVAFQVFDAAVNHGTGQAAKWLQAAVGTAQDGQIGPLTLNAAAGMNPTMLALLFNSARMMFYTNLPTWPTFGKGWARRVAG